MKNVIPFNKDIEFNNNIYEISSISLEHDEDILESINGVLVVSGEYRTHEISVNKEKFKYDIPYSVELDDNIIRDTVTVDIDDFKYEFKENILSVSISLAVYGEKNEEEKELEREVDNFFEKIDDRVVSELETIDEKTSKLEEEQPKIDMENEEDRGLIDELDKLVEENNDGEEKEEIAKEEIVENKEVVLNSVSSDSEYITYKVHIVSESETIESICALYKVNSSFIAEYNDITNINIGDKLIIPIEKNE